MLIDVCACARGARVEGSGVEVHPMKITIEGVEKLHGLVVRVTKAGDIESVNHKSSLPETMMGHFSVPVSTIMKTIQSVLSC